MYLDLAELEDLENGSPMLSRAYISPLSFQRADHLGDPQQPLAFWVHEKVKSETGMQLSGPIRLLTQLRQWGQYFSPLNLYYCWDHPDGRIAAVVAEVSNIPWGEKHAYVLWEGNKTCNASPLDHQHEKAFHVSPFMDMKQLYRWSLGTPGDELHVSITSLEQGDALFQANMTMKRIELSTRALIRQMLRYPLPRFQIIAAIYYQAFKLWWKQCPVYPHPNSHSARPQKSI